MMEIVYGPVIASCALKSVAFGLLFALLFPILEARFAGGGQRSLIERFGLALTGTGVFGLTHLAFVCASDGFPPRIIQSTAVGLALIALLGMAVLAKFGRRKAKA